MKDEAEAALNVVWQFLNAIDHAPQRGMVCGFLRAIADEVGLRLLTPERKIDDQRCTT